MSEWRPSGELDGAAELLASARARVAAALADLALPEALRLSDRQRNLVASLLASLVRSTEDELRAALAGAFPDPAREPLRAALTSAYVEIALPILTAQPSIPDPALMAALLRRAEEHRLHRSAGADNALLLDLTGDRDEAVAAGAMALLIAQSGRHDAFQEPLIGRGELSAELAHRLVWTVAAALRLYAIGRHGVDPAEADAAVADAAARLLAGHDEGESIDARCLRLVRRLRDAGRLDDDFVARALSDGGLPLFLAAVAARAGVDSASAWELVSEPSGRGPALLLRAAAIGRGAAARILLALAAEEADTARRLDQFDSIGEPEARGLLGLWRADPGYRAALAGLAA
jgi:Uncharacterised protein conserved in bacteria (DUF2336)